jgi:hypothetical protein
MLHRLGQEEAVLAVVQAEVVVVVVVITMEVVMGLSRGTMRDRRRFCP